MAKEPRTKLVEPKKAGPFVSAKVAEISAKKSQPFRDLYHTLKKG